MGRLAGSGVQRLLSLVTSLVTLATIAGLGVGAVQRAELAWVPLNLFRMSPALQPDGLSIMAATVIVAISGALLVGIRGQVWAAWRGWMLVALSGCLIAIFGVNLLALAIGSALLDMALLAIAASSSGQSSPARRMSPSCALPGLISTLILFFAALQMDSLVGHASLASSKLPEESLRLIGIAALLRSFVFPFHARQFGTPVLAATLLPPVAMGGFLLVRVQGLLPVLTAQSWAMPVAMVAMLAGGLLVWSRGEHPVNRPLLGGLWSGLLVQSVGFLFVSTLVLPGNVAWHLVNVLLSLTVLVVWLDALQETREEKQGAWLAWVSTKLAPWWSWAKTTAQARLPVMAWFFDVRARRAATLLLPAIALVSLAGMPLTTGARGRWSVYAALLQVGSPSLLLVLIGDTLLAAGLWIAIRATWTQPIRRRLDLGCLLAMTGLVALTVTWGVAPGALTDGLELQNARLAGVSIWGLGLLYLLPWLLGVWLVRIRSPLKEYLARVERLVNLDWLDRMVVQIAEQLVRIIHWLGRVGEGDGWWGWALIVLSVGFILLAAR
jgi:hypothetical protein